jgi:hypothetical protein
MARGASPPQLGTETLPPLRLASWVAALWRRAVRQRKGRELDVKAVRQLRLEHFNSEVYGHVEGWLGDRIWQVVNAIGTILDANSVCGNIAEFGVHHGLFLFLLNTLRNEGEECYAIDVFDQQNLNIDGSGRGSLLIFTSHVESLMGSQLRSFRIVQRDTMSFSTSELAGLFGKKGVKFFSIDAGHTIQHTFNDLYLVQEVLVPGGIVALDDYMSVHWPGVTEGFYRFIYSANRRLKPFLYFQNKLFLTTVSEHGLCLQQFRTAIEAICGDEIRSGRWKDVEIAGANCLSFA